MGLRRTCFVKDGMRMGAVGDGERSDRGSDGRWEVHLRDERHAGGKACVKQ